MHEYWGYCATCRRSYPCSSSGVPGSLPIDFRCVRCHAAPERLEIRLDGPGGHVTSRAGGPLSAASGRAPRR